MKKRPQILLAIALIAPLLVSGRWFVWKTATGATATEFVTSTPTGSPTVTGLPSIGAGFQMTVGAASITVTELARWVAAGNSQSHTITIIETGTGMSLGSVTVNASGASVGWLYGTLTSPVVLSAGATYVLAATESGTDAWYDEQTYTTTSAASINGLVYENGLIGGARPGHAYVPVNLKYHL